MASKSVYMPKDDLLHIRISKLQRQEVKAYAEKHYEGDLTKAVLFILDEKIHPEERDEIVERKLMAG